jgi:hypothetical protein
MNSSNRYRLDRADAGRAGVDHADAQPDRATLSPRAENGPFNDHRRHNGLRGFRVVIY